MIKSIKKARKNGWDKFDHYNKFEMQGDKVKFISDDKHKLVVGIALVHINEIIFDIDFAKAIWDVDGAEGWEWKDHLKEIVLKKNRIAYLNKYEI